MDRDGVKAGEVVELSKAIEMDEVVEVGIDEAQERIRIMRDKVNLAFTRIVI